MDGLSIVSAAFLWIVILATGFLLLGALRTIARLSWRLDQLEATTPNRLGRSGLNPGTKAPDFTLMSAAGTETGLQDYAGRRLVLIFTQPNCGPCHDVVPALNVLYGKGEVQVVAICNGDAATVRQWAAEVGARFPVLGQEHWKVSKKYEVFATPFGFLVDGDGIIRAKGVANQADHLGFLLEGSRDRARTKRVEPVAAPAAMAQVEDS